MTTAERSAQLAQGIAADVRTLRSAAARLAEAARVARHAIEDAQVAAQSFYLSDFSEPQVLGP